MTLPALPIDEVLGSILQALDQHQCCLLIAPPGTGKTTRVPGAILDHGLEGEVLVLQPRRLAARSAARRVAQERGSQLGQEVGFQVRHERRVSAQTRIRFVTEGVLIRQLLSDPFLPGVGAVVLDEFHERHLEGDLAIAFLKEIRTTVRPDLRLLVMSATLDPEPLQKYLDPCPLVKAQQTLHPVQVNYLPGSRGDLPTQVVAAVQQALAQTDGDVLVFLPGVGEIRACQKLLQGRLKSQEILLLPLHGQLAPEQQDQAIRPQVQRKVVLSTNVAESSVTIPGVTAVVDSGLVRRLRHDPGRGLDRLAVESVSMASAEQRSGRAGRTGPGSCYRLWHQGEERGMPAFETPEIRRLDLASVVLQVRNFSAQAPQAFAWFEAPEQSALQRADQLLCALEAVDEQTDRLTQIGQQMLQYPLHPRLARMMLEAKVRGCVKAAAELAAILSEAELQRRGAAYDSERTADLLELQHRLQLVEDQSFHPAVCETWGLSNSAARAVTRARDQIAKGKNRGGSDLSVQEDELLKTLLAGFPDRVGKRSAPHSMEGLLATGRGVRFNNVEGLDEYFLALQVREGTGQRQQRALVSLACHLQDEWLSEVHPAAIRNESSVELDADRGAVVAVQRRYFLDLVLDERRSGKPDPAQAEQLLAQVVEADPWPFLRENKDLAGFRTRCAWLREQMPELALPELGLPELAAALAALCAGKTRLSQLQDAPVLDVLRSQLSRAQSEALRLQAPSHVTLPSGRRAKVLYESQGPCVAGRVQEFFGLQETPRIGGGKTPVLLHLLAPNLRPVQMTKDLASFWVNVYPKVRSELRRRYPRHSWPADPLTASAEARPPRRRP